MRVLYIIGDLIRMIMFDIAGYRKQIIADNLHQAFPDKSPKEVAAIQQKFYKNFCDQWMETLKAISMPVRVLQQNCPGNWEVLKGHLQENRNVVLLLGHFFNWEWANLACAMQIEKTYAGVYLPLSNIIFDRLILHMRTRSGAMMISMKSLKGGFSKLTSKPYVLALIADQNPSVPDVAYWHSFMHREAPFFKGSVQMAIRSQAAILLASIRKEKRGLYRIAFHTLTENAKNHAAEELMNAYINFLEDELRSQPENWLWSHRRWKHTRQNQA